MLDRQIEKLAKTTTQEKLDSRPAALCASAMAFNLR
jgi:hypothetical protein